MPQVVGGGAQRVRAVSGIGQMRQESRHRTDFVARIVEQDDSTDNAAVTFLDHSHTGLPLPVLTASGSSPTSGRAASRPVEITQNSASAANT
jgi:hypothetical protein